MLSNAKSTPVPGSTPPPGLVASGEGPSRQASVDRVQAPLNFLVNTAERPEIHVTPGVVERRRTGVYEAKAVTIHDGRPIAQRFSLDREGFALEHHRTAAVDLYDDEEVRSVYYPEIERLVKTATGASQVLIFDHTVRVEGAGGSRKASRDAARWVHNDYTERSAPRTLGSTP